MFRSMSRIKQNVCYQYIFSGWPPACVHLADHRGFRNVFEPFPAAEFNRIITDIFGVFLNFERRIFKKPHWRIFPINEKPCAAEQIRRAPFGINFDDERCSRRQFVRNRPCPEFVPRNRIRHRLFLGVWSRMKHSGHQQDKQAELFSVPSHFSVLPSSQANSPLITAA